MKNDGGREAEVVENNNKVCVPACDICSPTLSSYLSPTQDTKKISFAHAVGILSNTINASPRKTLS